MVSGFGCEVWASVQMTASRPFCLTQHSLPITRLFVTVRDAFWVLLSFSSLLAAVLFLSFADSSGDGWSERRTKHCTRNCSSEINFRARSILLLLLPRHMRL